MLDAFHFIRPGMLLLALPAALVIWAILRRQDPLRSWQAVIAPELLEHLVVRSEVRRSRLRPALVMGFAWLAGIIAVAGPTWEKEPTPLTEDQSALFILLKVTPDMLAQDVQPSRLQRAAQKVGGLLALRPGSRTGLIAYAGSAHLVMPLTSDPEVIRFFAAELTPDVMPQDGDEPAQAVALANRRLESSGLPGSVVLVADHVAEQQLGELERIRDAGGADVHVYAMAAGSEVIVPVNSPPAAALDRDAMARAAAAGGGSLVVVSPDDRDIRQLAGQVERSIRAAPLQEGERWVEFGYWLGLLFVPLMLLFFRPGGAVALQS
jgi:Ca-activated chloride channel family protein